MAASSSFLWPGEKGQLFSFLFAQLASLLPDRGLKTIAGNIMTGTDGWLLKSRWRDDGTETGCMILSLMTQSSEDLPSDTRLAITSLTRIPPGTALVGGNLIKRSANYHEFSTFAPSSANGDGRLWEIIIPRLSHKPQHYTDGPSSAFLIFPDGSTQPVACAPFEKEGNRDKAPLQAKKSGAPKAIGPALGLLPMAHHTAITSWAEQVPLGFFCDHGEETIKTVNGLYQRLFPGQATPFIAAMPANGASGDYVNLVCGKCKFEAQATGAFRLSFAKNTLHLEAETEIGTFYGLIAIAQIWYAARQNSTLFAMPRQGVIEDWPRHAWRAMHLDVSRQFYTPATIQEFLDILAWNRINRFHWHLTDDEGWRLECLTYPTLTTVGAFRGHTLPLYPQLGHGADRYGGYYSRADVKAILAHANGLHIDVMPEIDIPGHCQAALAAVPDLLDPSAMVGGASVQGYVNNALNPGLSATWQFLERLFGEVAALFPGSYIHIGGDEVAEGAWAGSRSAQSWARAKGHVDGNVAPDSMKMQAALLQFVANRLTEAGKKPVAWQEAAKGGGLDPDKAILMAWMKPESGPDLTAQGYEVVMCPGQAYYLDMAQASNWNEPGLSWAGTSSPEDTYRFDSLAGFEKDQASVIGLQGCIWSENLLTRRLFNHMVFPRLSAIAEAAWLTNAQKDWTTFANRHPFMPTLKQED